MLSGGQSKPIVETHAQRETRFQKRIRDKFGVTQIDKLKGVLPTDLSVVNKQQSQFPVSQISLSFDGSVVGYFSTRQSTARQLHLVLQEQRNLIYTKVQSYSLSDDGMWVAIGYIDNTVTVRDIRTNKKIFDCDFSVYKSDHPTALGFSPDKKTLVVFLKNGVVVKWNLNKNDKLVIGYQWMAKQVTFSSSGNIFASMGADSSINLWRSDAPARPVTVVARDGWSTGFAFSPDSTKIAFAGKNYVNICDVSKALQTPIVATQFSHIAKDQCVSQFALPLDAITSVAFSMCGQFILCGQLSGEIAVASLTDHELQVQGRMKQSHATAVTKIVLSSNGAVLVTASVDKEVFQWDFVPPAKSDESQHAD